jgi:hypothetical protein
VAAVISMAIAVVVIAFLGRSITVLRQARAEFQRRQAEYLLESAHNAALLSIATSAQAPPYSWTMIQSDQVFTVVAEPEWFKLSPAAAVRLDDALLDRLGVSDPAILKGTLGRLAARHALFWPADADETSGWKTCAGALISFYGTAVAPPALAYSKPTLGSGGGRWRAGEVWRVMVTSSEGWRDERILRFTGNGLNPASTIARRLSSKWKDSSLCEPLLAA